METLSATVDVSEMMSSEVHFHASVLSRDVAEIVPSMDLNGVRTPIKSLQGRSVRLDVLAVDDSGSPINIEIQREDKGAGSRRARYHSSILDANLLLAGENFEELPET